MRAGLNIKIVLHWIAVVIGIISLIVINVNQQISIALIAFLTSTLVFNQVTFIYMQNEKMVFIKRVLFVVPVYKKSIKISDIKSIKLYQDTVLPEFEGSVISSVIAGSYFYDSNWRINIELYYNEILENDLNLTEKDIRRLQEHIKLHFH